MGLDEHSVCVANGDEATFRILKIIVYAPLCAEWERLWAFCGEARFPTSSTKREVREAEEKGYCIAIHCEDMKTLGEKRDE